MEGKQCYRWSAGVAQVEIQAVVQAESERLYWQRVSSSTGGGCIALQVEVQAE